MSQHTPGPWEVWEGPSYVGGGRDLCIGAGETWLANMEHRASRCPDVYSPKGHPGDWNASDCDICTVDSIRITAEQEANARLIAAAPDLLDALEALVHDDGVYAARKADALAARLAVARARGTITDRGET